ncbi:hypothetical protein DYB32_005520 [Aphanomyces invadans]|uniref:Peptidase S1 domain-containing protein n=1 Tax=Aphanomyces invadans TaxID=157072 RepID=A0A418AUB4_9STRA|nr:hypothetical protein DYB32_005520 [Aphanomyces invadans]
MSYIAALLCLHMPTDRFLTFQCLANVMVHEHLFTFYLLDVDLAHNYYMWFDEFFKMELPQLFQHFNSIGVPTSLFLMNWLQTLFLQVLPLEVASRVLCVLGFASMLRCLIKPRFLVLDDEKSMRVRCVFDNFLLDGVLFLFRTALAILTLLGPTLLENDLDVALPLLQRHYQHQSRWFEALAEDKLFATIAAIHTPSHVYMGVETLVQNVYFYLPGTASAAYPQQKVSDRAYVVTAAHCVTFRHAPPKELFVSVGSVVHNGTDGDIRTVAMYWTAPTFMNALLGSDIAVLKLSAPSTKRPVALSNDSIRANTSTIAFGWGATSPSAYASATLLQANLTTIDSDECQRRIRASSNDSSYTSWHATDSHMCAGGIAGTGTCYGDSGGPVVVNPSCDDIEFPIRPRQPVLVGTVSFGVACAAGVPDVFSRLSTAKPFIDKYSVGHTWIE